MNLSFGSTRLGFSRRRRVCVCFFSMKASHGAGVVNAFGLALFRYLSKTESEKLFAKVEGEVRWDTLTHRIHIWYIYLRLPPSAIHVGRFFLCIDPMGLIFFWFQTLVFLLKNPMVLVWSFAEVIFWNESYSHFLEARRILSDLSLAKYDEVYIYIY